MTNPTKLARAKRGKLISLIRGTERAIKQDRRDREGNAEQTVSERRRIDAMRRKLEAIRG